MDKRTAQVIAGGSPEVSLGIGALAPGVFQYHSLEVDFPQVEDLYDFLDSWVISNASAQPVEFHWNGMVKTLLPGQVQTVTGHQVRNYRLRNIGLLATVANEVRLQARRMPSDLKTVMSLSI